MTFYKQIHKIFNDLPRFKFPYDNIELKRLTDLNGLYVLFEKGEQYEDLDRIVRIGSHDGHNRLLNRMGDHFLKQFQRSSILRKHLGRCYLTINSDDYLENWNLTYKKKEDKFLNQDRVNLQYESSYENLITKYIQENLTFTLIPKIYERGERDRLEEGLISCLSQSTLKQSSVNWIGNSHPDFRIRNSKIWNIEYLNARPITGPEVRKLIMRLRIEC